VTSSTRRFWTVVLAASTCLAAGGCGTRAAEEEKAVEPVVPVRLEPLGSRSFEDVIDANGAWRSQGELIVAAPFSGVVERISARPGDPVAAGQAVGSLTTLESHAALRGALALQGAARDSASRNEARAALELARRDQVQVALTSPQAGIVVRRPLEPGTQVTEGTEILAIVPWNGMVFEAHVPQEQRGRVRLGQRAVIRERGQEPRAAVVRRILPAADPADQSTLVWLAPVKEAPRPQLDHFGSAAIVIGAAHTAIAVPDSAVIEVDLTGEKRIAVIDSGLRARWTTVTLGAGAGGWHELRSPALPPGSRVVIEGQRGLPEGARVRSTP